jgi:hypothetical protein
MGIAFIERRLFLVDLVYHIFITNEENNKITKLNLGQNVAQVM